MCGRNALPISSKSATSQKISPSLPTAQPCTSRTSGATPSASSTRPRSRLQENLSTGWGPGGLTTDRPGKTLYVANSIGNDVSVIDLATGTELKRLTALRSPHYVQLSRDGRRVYVSNVLAHLESADETPVSELMVIDTQTQDGRRSRPHSRRSGNAPHRRSAGGRKAATCWCLSCARKI